MQRDYEDKKNRWILLRQICNSVLTTYVNGNLIPLTHEELYSIRLL